MKRRFKKTRLTFILVLLLTMNFLGITYAYWEDGLDINMKLETGDIIPEFTGVLPISKKNSVSVDYSGDTMFANGQLKPHEAAMIFYEISNKGSVPMKLTDVNCRIDKGIIVNNLGPIGIIDAKDKQKGYGALQIGAWKTGHYNFEIELTYSQFNSQEDYNEKVFSFDD